MEPTTVTSIVMVLFGAGLIAMALRNLFGDWEPQVRRISEDELREAEIRAAVRDMRRAIRDWERGHHH